MGKKGEREESGFNGTTMMKTEMGQRGDKDDENEDDQSDRV